MQGVQLSQDYRVTTRIQFTTTIIIIPDRPKTYKSDKFTITE